MKASIALCSRARQHRHGASNPALLAIAASSSRNHGSAIGHNIEIEFSRVAMSEIAASPRDKQILAHANHRMAGPSQRRGIAKADWQFATATARVKLKRLYPQFE